MSQSNNSSQILMSGSFQEGEDGSPDVAAIEVVQPVPEEPEATEEAPTPTPAQIPKADSAKEPVSTLDVAEEAEDTPQKQTSTPVSGQPGRRATINLGSMAFEVDIPSELEESQKRQTLMEDEEFLQAKGGDVKLRLPVRQINSNTCRCCGIMCSMWIISIVVLILLSLTVGTIQFDIGVPFYDRSEINEEREDAYLATQRDADYVATIKSTADGTSVCVHEAPTLMTRNGTLIEGPAPGENCQLASTQRLRILYVSSDRESNILTPENLEQIRKIEAEFLSHQELPQYCHLIASNYSAFTSRNAEEIVGAVVAAANASEFNYRSCSRIGSVLNFMDYLYFIEETGLGYHLMNEDLIPQEYDLSIDNIESVVNFWSNYTTQSYDLSAFPAAVQQVGNQIILPNIFHSVVSSDFVQGSTGAIGVISTYDLGLPINGFASSSQQADDQYAETGTFLWEEFDSFLKDAGFEGVDVYFSDTENAMRDAETGYLAIQSFSLFPASVLFVLVYLIYMQDSIYVGVVGIMQIMLCFVPCLVIYTYIFQVTYLGVLNLIAVYIIMGIGVDDLFVFCDQWKHHAYEKRFGQRLQKTFNVASKAMFTTSCTTFIAFISNASSAFPAVATFGIFAAILVLVNFCAITFFFPAAFGVYFKFIRGKWFDHPSRLFCCNRKIWTDDVYVKSEGSTLAESAEKEKGDELEPSEGEEVATPTAEKETEETNAEEEDEVEKKEAQAVNKAHDVKESALVRFFRDVWAPLMIKLRYPIVLIYIGVLIGAIVLAGRLEPDESAPNTLPDDNVYRQFTDVLLEYFARSGNPAAIDVHWVAGINPDDPIDRSGTSRTNSTDYGVANYVDCSVYDPTTAEAQVWSLQTCQDMFFGNVTAYHGDSSEFGKNGTYGPRQRKILTDRVPQTVEWYYQLVSCPHQGFRDWLLTDYGCTILQQSGLPCYNETSTRPNCMQWDTEGNSCEPYPVPRENYASLFEEFMLDPNFDPSTRKTNYDKYFREIFASEIPDLDPEQQEDILRDDFSCRVGDNLVVLAISSTATLDQSFEQNYEDGIELYEKWDEWSIQMRKFAPREMLATMQTSSGAWSYYFLNETLLNETYRNIALSLVLSFIVLSLVGGNPIMAFLSVATIAMIVMDIFAFTVLMGWKLGVLEAINYVVVIGLSIDYTVHLSEAYTESHATDRRNRVTLMLEEMGVSVLSGAISTLGACFFMFFAPNTFFVKFAGFIFATITLSCLYSLTFFPALLSIVGPTGNVGNCCFWGAKHWRHLKHKFAVRYVETEEFKRRELVSRMQQGEIETLVSV